ncbi:MAG TPA: DUF1840 domain-containing protein [Comamonadaceae bacterium]|uniref:DUF1840 domain-containing protein n=1 Tax=Pulveribacter sp. TaxID=2678893 RepID=UPI000EC3EE7D|nr:DUF1840 domain-containing protein [Pulveribacter sp.]HCL85108.1 DUF1840 domain-containing protein [Comamonadaceae bacterium]
MLYKFKSRATADLIMLEPNGRQLLKIVGKGEEPHGIITAAQIPAAIEALQAAVAAEEAAEREQQAQQQQDAPAAQDGEEPQDGPGQSGGEVVRLRQRAAPFIDMLKRSAAESKDVTW